ncbi:MAG: hypothetical protein KDI36_11510 [Pseudomonadales bacterium]|nr:hypothetical protein [Pseudomonadales bacterium]
MVDKSKDLDLIPAIAPAKDEVASYRRSSRSDAPKQSNFNGLLVFTIALMAIMMGVGGYTLWEVQNKLAQANALLEQGQKNIRDLEDRLAATGTDVSKTLQEMKEQQKTNVSEIDKLWGVSYRQNRPKIQELESSIAKLRERDKALDTQIGNQVASVNKVTSRFDTFSNDMVELRQSLIQDNEEMTTQVSMVRSQIQDQATIVEGNRRNVTALQNRMKDAEEAIEVIDKYRAQTNRKLVDLETRIQQQAGTAP